MLAIFFPRVFNLKLRLLDKANTLILLEMVSVALIHIGKTLPAYFFDCLHQIIIVNGNSAKIHVLIDDTLVESARSALKELEVDIYFKYKVYPENFVEFVPISVLQSTLENNSAYQKYHKLSVSTFSSVSEFRDGFWISTTMRFFYIEALMQIYKIQKLFHIENDVMLYESFKAIYDTFCTKDDDIPSMVQDSDDPPRVVPSIMFFPNHSSICKITTHIANTLKEHAEKQTFANDMDILGSYKDKHTFPISPNDFNLYFDGAAIGQYLGGIDPRNINESQKYHTGVDYLNEIDNPTVGFVNEISDFKPNLYNFNKTFVYTDDNTIPMKLYTSNSKTNNKLQVVANLHIHSKQLYKFNSAFDIDYNDIISGDRVVNMCDFILSTKEIYEFHKNIQQYTKGYIISKTLIVRNFNKPNISLLNKYFIEHCVTNGKNVVNLFVYSHILDAFMTNILPKLNSDLRFNLYVHNSDHAFNDSHAKLLNDPMINHVYAQNIDCSVVYKNLTLLPIGIANAMWPHGDIPALYNVMSDAYKYKKRKALYVNINPNTYGYRKQILDVISQTKNFEISTNKPYPEYLRELSQHRFCLCMRGNGIDTHRFWESLYLGVIPVIINNATTKCENFIEYLKMLEVPFVEMTGEVFEDALFSENIYKSKLIKFNSSIYNLRSLKMSFYASKSVV